VQTFKAQMRRGGLFVAAMWVVFLLQCVRLPIDVNAWGLRPRTLGGLVGIVTMPFLHQSLMHLLGNSISLVILLALLAASRVRPWSIVAALIVAGGGLLWLFGRPGNHVGASGLIFALMAFLLLSGFLEKKLISLLISVLVALFYGGTLLVEMIPRTGADISWDGHLLGAVAGALMAYVPLRLARRGTPRRAGGRKRIA
jgi:membrane associated rhomboid family serine protease